MAQEAMFGKLSSEDLRILVNFWAGLDALRADVSGLIRANPDRILPLSGICPVRSTLSA